MSAYRKLTAFAAVLMFIATAGCSSTRTHESTGEYVDDSAITTRVKSAILAAPGLKASEINVETSKGVVRLSGFVSSRADIDSAVSVASGVGGVKSVKNSMHVK